MLSDKALCLFTVLLLSTFTLSTAQFGVCRINSRPQQTCLATDPTTFTINDFSTFEPLEGNPAPASVSFRFSDDNNALAAQCFSSNDTLADISFPAISDSPQVSFTYVENNLTITENYTFCQTGASTELEGLLEVATNCYSTYPPSPMGNGIKCITPTGKLSGLFV